MVAGDHRLFKIVDIVIDPFHLLIVEMLVDVVPGGDVEGSVQGEKGEGQGRGYLPCSLVPSRRLGRDIAVMQSGI